MNFQKVKTVKNINIIYDTIDDTELRYGEPVYVKWNHKSPIIITEEKVDILRIERSGSNLVEYISYIETYVYGSAKVKIILRDSEIELSRKV